MKFLTCVVILASIVAGDVSGQENAKGLLDLAAKKAGSAKGRTADEAAAILKEAAGLYEQAIAKFPAAKPETARAHLEIGRIRRKLNDLPGAEAALKEAAAATEEPRIASEALHDLASIYRKTKRLPEAQHALERIVAEFQSEPRQRAEALSRLASLHRAAKRMDASEAALRQILTDHADLFSHAIDALDDLVALKIGQGHESEARSLHAKEGEALKTKFNGTRYESKVQPALDKIATRFKLADDDDGE